MEDPRIELLKSVSIEGTRVEFSDSPIVLLCGGIVPEKQHPEDVDPPLASLRHAISLETTSLEFFRPEEITDWQTDAIYPNLMEFEKDLSGICSLVVIILESPGSIAELGAFSQLEDLRQRLMVFTSSHYLENSFIRLGILRHIELAKEGSVRSYPWKIEIKENEALSFDENIIRDIVSDIDDQISSLPKSNVFKNNNNSHVIALICQFLALFIALKIGELQEYLRYFNVEITEDELKRKLFLLERFRLIIKDHYSDSVYYFSLAQPFHSVRFGSKKTVPFDFIRVRAGCAAFYANTNDRHRLGFLKKVTAKGDNDA